MSKEKPDFNHGLKQHCPLIKPLQEKSAEKTQEWIAIRLAVLSVVNQDLRVVSTKTTSLMKRTLFITSQTTEMVARSREAIAHSRDLLATVGRIIQN